MESFVGGASDGSVGVAAMRYTNPFTHTLSFQKAWFFLDNDVQHIMLSSAASNSSADHPVISVLDQKRLNGPVYVNGRAVHEGGNFTSPQTLWHDNVGYAFAQESAGSDVNVAVDFGARSGNWSAIGISTVGEITVDLFSAWINHGAGTDLAVPVEFTAFPATSLREFQRKTVRTSEYLKTIRNDAAVSAVYDAKHRTVMAVFWVAQGGTVTFTPSPVDASITIQASANSAVIYKLDEGTVTVSDPSQKVTTLQLSFEVDMVGRRPRGWGSELTKTVEVVMPTGGLGGKSVSVTL